MRKDRPVPARYGLYNLMEVGAAVTLVPKGLISLAEKAELPPIYFDFNLYDNKTDDPSHEDLIYCTIDMYMRHFFDVSLSRYLHTYFSPKKLKTYSDITAADHSGWFIYRRLTKEQARTFFIILCSQIVRSESLAGLLDFEHLKPNNQDRHCFAKYRLISKKQKNIFATIGVGLEGDKQRRIAHWTLVKYFLHEHLTPLLDIWTRIENETPLIHGELYTFARYLAEGALVPRISVGDDWSFAIDFRAVYRDDEMWPHQEQAARLLLAPAVYDMCRRLEKFSRDHPKCFIRHCHAPSCMRPFYTSRQDARCCPRTRAGRRSSCKAEWDAYRKWLNKVYPKKDPEKVWYDTKLKDNFLSQYHPRGSQSSVR